MARPKKCRRICALPCEREFIPASGEKGVVSLSLDELETLRLLDLERLTQEECALQMGVARATAALIYDSARRKVAEALVLGQRLSLIHISAGIERRGTAAWAMRWSYRWCWVCS